MHELIKNNNYLHIPDFISPERARELSKRFTNFCKSQNLSGDIQAENSHSAYNYIDFLELLCEKTPEVSKFLGESVLPTYSYARVYKEGSVLTRHRDRAACEISLTLHLSSDADWPIYIQKPNGEEVELNLNSGEAMMYRGDVADHWRNKFEGKEYVQVFLHYVRSRGDNNWAFFDKLQPDSTKLLMDIEPTPVNNIEAPVVITTKKSLDDYIQVFDNVLSDELCDSILKEYSYSAEGWIPTAVGGGVIDRSIRNVDTIQMSFEPTIQQNPVVRKFLDQEVFLGAGKAITKYNEVFPDAQIQEDSGYELLRYTTGQFYTRHTDSFKQRPRAVSCSFALNDDYSGGEFSFWSGEKVVKAKKGSAIMFPSNFMYPHEIMPVTSGTRYSIITWFI